MPTVEERLEELERNLRDVQERFPTNALRIASEGHVHNIVIAEKGSGAPTHKSQEGTLYWDTAANALYANDDGDTSWTSLAGGVAGQHTLDSTTHTDVAAFTEAVGDLLYRPLLGAPWNKLAIGTADEVLTVAGGIPSWTALPFEMSFPITMGRDTFLAP